MTKKEFKKTDSKGREEIGSGKKPKKCVKQ